MIRLALLAAALTSSCDVGPFPKDPTTAPSSWPADGPIEQEVFRSAGGGSGCSSAIENTKRLGCGFEADDAVTWCATRTTREVACMCSAKACLALRKCTELVK